MTLNGNKMKMDKSISSLMINHPNRQLIKSIKLNSVMTKLQNSFVKQEIETTLSQFLTNKSFSIMKVKGANKA